MRRLIVAALSALILLCISISTPKGRGLCSIRWTSLMINLLHVGSPAATSLRPGAPPAQSSADERGAAPSAQESVSLEPGKPVERELSAGQSHSYKIAMTSGQYLRITVSQQGIDALVALIACQTGLGKEIKGEGLVGLAHGFMYAGAPRIVASLWKVDDRATSELMKRFYQGLLGPERLRPAGASRQAQLSIWKQKQ